MFKNFKWMVAHATRTADSHTKREGETQTEFDIRFNNEMTAHYKKFGITL